MGKNYYVGPGREGHIGKSSALGRGKGYQFIWAMPPRQFLVVALDHGRVKHFGVDVATCDTCQAIDAVIGASAEEFDSIGEKFS